MSPCPNCNADNPSLADFCPSCGTYLAELTTSRPAGGAQAVAEAPARGPVADPGPSSTAVLTPPPPPPAPVPIGLALRVPGQDGPAGAVPVLHVEPGREVTLVAAVRNRGPVVNSYTARIDGLPAEWTTPTPATLHLNPFVASDGASDGEVHLRIRPPRTSAAKAGPWALTVVVESRIDGSGDRASAPAELVIAPFCDLRATATPARRARRRRAHFDLEVHNAGNAPATVELSATEPEERFGLEVRPAQVHVEPGGDPGRARLTATPARQIWIGRAVDTPIDLAAGPAEAAVRLEPRQVTFRQRPWLPWWLAVALPLLVAAVLLLLALRPEVAVVPDLRGAESPFRAQQALAEAGLRLEPEVARHATDDVAPGTVIEQAPAPGAEAPAGSPVAVMVAEGSGRATVPDVTGMLLAQAEAALDEAGLKLGSADPLDAEAPIASQVPAAGQQRPEGTPVNVQLGDEAAEAGPDPAPAPGPKAVPSPAPDPAPGPPPAPTVAFDDGRDLFLLAPGATEPEPLSTGGGALQPSVDAAGGRMAFRRVQDGKGRIHLLGPGGQGFPGTPLTDDSADWHRPAFAPDGRTVAFVRGAPAYDVCVQAADGAPGSHACLHDDDWAFNRPAFDPEGGSVVVVARHREDAEQTGLFQFRLRSGEDGPELERVEQGEPRGLVARIAQPQFVAWAPGPSIAVMAGPESSPAQLHLMDVTADGVVDGASAKAAPVFGCEIAWLPDGRLVVAERACASVNGPIVLTDAEGAQHGRLVSVGGNPTALPEARR